MISRPWVALGLLVLRASAGHASEPSGGLYRAWAENPSNMVTAQTATIATNEKEYEKPDPVPLPEGDPARLSGSVALVAFNAIVNPGMGNFVMESIRRAEDEGAQFLLIELDTPGGLVSTTQEMVQAILSARIPIVVYVTPSGAHAASAGTFITLAAHVAAMAPATRIGAAHPVTGDGRDPEEAGGTHMARKAENDLLAMVEGLSSTRNRNVEWAKDAVRDSVSADAEKAVEIGVVDLIAQSRAELLQMLHERELMMDGRKVAFDLEDPRVVEYQPSLRNRVLNLLANPGVAAILGVLGLLGILVEIYSPGLIAPGVLGVLAILCSLISVGQLPINVGAVLLLLIGVGLLFAELYTPTFGALGFLGLAGLGLGLVLLVDVDNPAFDLDPSFAISWLDVLPLLVLVAGLMVYLSVFVVRRKIGPKLSGVDTLLGKSARVLRTVSPQGGQVFVDGEYWTARSRVGQLEPDQTVRVVAVEGMKLIVDDVASASALPVDAGSDEPSR
ncbi:MAG: nodulation protein NfeD [Myxococcota bacterium]